MFDSFSYLFEKSACFFRGHAFVEVRGVLVSLPEVEAVILKVILRTLEGKNTFLVFLHRLRVSRAQVLNRILVLLFRHDRLRADHVLLASFPYRSRGRRSLSTLGPTREEGTITTTRLTRTHAWDPDGIGGKTNAAFQHPDMSSPSHFARRLFVP